MCFQIKLVFQKLGGRLHSLCLCRRKLSQRNRGFLLALHTISNRNPNCEVQNGSIIPSLSKLSLQAEAAGLRGWPESVVWARPAKPMFSRLPKESSTRLEPNLQGVKAQKVRDVRGLRQIDDQLTLTRRAHRTALLGTMEPEDPPVGWQVLFEIQDDDGCQLYKLFQCSEWILGEQQNELHKF